MLKNSINKTESNDIAKWLVIVLALSTLIFNTITLFNDVKHLKENQIRIIKEISELKTALIMKK